VRRKGIGIEEKEGNLKEGQEKGTRERGLIGEKRWKWIRKKVGKSE
jgi:hypothetical protein